SHPVRLAAAVADDIVAELTLGSLDRLVDFTLRYREAFTGDLEVMNEAFDRIIDVLFRRIAYLRLIGQNRSRLQSIKRLRYDLYRFSHLDETNLVTVKRIAFLADRHLEAVFLIPAVGIVAAKIPVNSGTAQCRTGNAGIDGILGRDHAIADCPLHPDGILGKESFISVQVSRKGVDDLLNILLEPVIYIRGETADPEIVAGHTRTGDFLVQLHDLLALTERIDKDRHGADIEGMTGNPDEMRLESRQFRQYYPHGLCPLRNLDAKKLLDRKNIAEIDAHRS